MTWTAVSDTTDPGWVGDSSTTDPGHSGLTETTVIWQQLSSVTDDNGVDFTMRVNDQYPLRVDDSRPAYVIDLEEDI